MAELIKKIKKVEFSKKVTVWILSVYAAIIFTMIGLLAFKNSELGGSFIAILGILTPIIMLNIGYYFNKAKAENILKLGNSTTSTSDSTSTTTTDTTDNTVTDTTTDTLTESTTIQG